jgi:hypothetical protein
MKKCEVWETVIIMGLHANGLGGRKPENRLIFHPPPPLRARQPLVGQGLLIIEASRSHSDTPHSVGLFWTSDQPDAETSTRQHTTFIRDRHSCPRRDSNSHSQQASGGRPTP